MYIQSMQYKHVLVIFYIILRIKVLKPTDT